MWQALAILFGFALTVAFCCLLGSFAVRPLPLRREERWPFAFILGSAILSGAVFLLCCVHQMRAGVMLALFAGVAWWAWRGGALAAMRAGESFDHPVPRLARTAFLLVFVPFSFCYWANSMAPEFSPDGSSYHLGWVARYAAAGGFDKPEASIYGMLSQGVELLYLNAFLFGRHSAAAMVHWAFLMNLAWLLACFGRRVGRPSAGLAAGIFVYASPVVGIDGTSAYIDLATACIGFALFYLLYIWDGARARGLLIAAGLLAGYAYAAKYTVAILAVWAMLFVLWRSRDRVRDAAVMAAMTLLLSAPWMARNAASTGNPLAPFFNRWFPNPHVHILFEQQYSEWLRDYDVKNKWELPLEVTIRGVKTTGAFGHLYLLTPLALLAARRREGRLLLGAALFALAPYPLNIGSRFLIPALPFLAMALALALDFKALLPTLMIAHALLAWPTWPPGLLAKVSPEYAWRLERIPWKEALRKVSEDDFLSARSDGYRHARMIDRALKPGERVLGLNGYAEAYSTGGREILVSYQSATNEKLMDILYAGIDDSRWPRLVWSFQLPRPLSIRAARLVQTFAADVRDEQWNVTEVRLFDGSGAELPRDPSWRLRARPNPWDVQMAFDNSPVTRWRSWQTASPGMFIEAALGAGVSVSRVDVQSSWDNPHCRVKLLLDRGAGWEEAGVEARLIEGEPRFWMRREATRELLSRGVQYLFFGPDEYGGRDFYEAQREWGIKLVGEESGKWLFRIEPYDRN